VPNVNLQRDVVSALDLNSVYPPVTRALVLDLEEHGIHLFVQRIHVRISRIVLLAKPPMLLVDGVLLLDLVERVNQIIFKRLQHVV